MRTEIWLPQKRMSTASRYTTPGDQIMSTQYSKAGNGRTRINDIAAGGNTTITSTASCDPAQPDSGFIIPSSLVCLNFDSDATFNSAEVCVVYDPNEVTSPFRLVQQYRNDGSVF